ncbi:MAG TPA: aminotransferase class III-fold pyridoxal phosphate-dependent enzyme, partial [Gemmatimonadaceae bacterium]
VDGNEYIDYLMALGPIVLGYAYPATDEAVRRQLANGISFSLMHPLEVELAELLTEIIPCAEMVRFGKNGSDVTSGAVRLSRAVTGREVIAAGGYHGWQDWFIGTTSRNRGVPKAVRELTKSFRYNHLEDLERIFAEHRGQVAAVILEPIHGEEPHEGFLQQVADLTRQEGAILIFDEVKTGFRFGLGGAQAHFGVTPDLACFGKAIANGMPLSALVGLRDVMKELEEVFFSFTNGGETLSLAAAIATIQEMQREPVVEHIWREGKRLKDGFNEIARELELERMTHCYGLPPMTLVSFVDDNGKESIPLRSLFQQEVIRRGILFDDGHFICYSHSPEDIDETLDAYREALMIVRSAAEAGDVAARLEGEMIRPIFQ